MRVLLVEDDRVLGGAVHEHVALLGHAVDWMQRKDDAELSLAAVEYELVLLDLNLPDGRGMDILRQMRKSGSTAPVIILTAQDQIAQRIDGLNAGADDYLVKPFDLSELTARIAAVARRYGGDPNPLFALGDADIDIATRSARLAGHPVTLTAREWTILERLLRHPNAVVSRSALEDALYAFGAEIASNAVEVYVSRVRKKLGRDAITTVRGAGYRVSGRK